MVGSGDSILIEGLENRADLERFIKRVNAKPSRESIVVNESQREVQQLRTDVDALVASATPDATSTVKGKLKLTNDLGGTADLPTVPGLAGKANTSHTHAQSDITSLVSDLAGKAATSHTHAQADVTGLVTDLANKQPLDSDLTAIAAIAGQTTFGRNLLALADAAAGRTAFGAAATSHTHAQSDITSLVSDLTLKAPLASPALTGNPTAPTQTPGNNSTRLATTAYADAIAALKANLASPTFTGTPAAPTATAGTNTTQLATTAFVTTADNLKANLASPTFTGTPAAPTAGAGTNTTQVATTAFVTTALTSVVLPSCRATRTTVLSFTNNTPAVVTLPTEDIDTNTFHDLVTNNSRLTVPTGLAGNYMVTGNVVWASNATGFRRASLLKNGVAFNVEGTTANAISGVATRLSFSVLLPLVATDYVEIEAVQNSGGNLDVTNASLQLVKIG
jgi:hypothetical protein